MAIEERLRLASPQRPTPWRAGGGWLSLLIAIVFTLIASAILFLPFLILDPRLFDDGHLPAWVAPAFAFVQSIIFIGAALLVANYYRPLRAQEFGLRRPISWPKALGWGLLCWILFYAVVMLMSLFLGGVGQKDVPQEMGAGQGILLSLLSWTVVCLLAPLVEEFFFRGFFFKALENWRGVWPAALLTGIVFGLMHGANSSLGALVPLAFFGVLLCFLYFKTGSLYPCVMLHCANNSVAFGLSLGLGITLVPFTVVSVAASGLVLWLISRKTRFSLLPINQNS